MNVSAEITAAETYHLDDQVGYLLRLASQRHAVIFQSHGIDGLTPTQFSALIRLSEVGEVSQNKLGRLVSTDAATIKGVVDRLREKGYVRSSPSRFDRRCSLVSLTEEGRALIADLKRAGSTISRETLSPLSTAERRTLVSLLSRIA